LLIFIVTDINNNFFKTYLINKKMQISLIIVIFLSSLLISVTIYSVYSAFGPDSKYLIDPFEEHED